MLKSVNDDNASLGQFSSLISSDPALSAEVLIISNSALLAQRHRVTSILQAVALLGTRTLKGVCLTVAVRAYLGKSMSYPAVRAIWRHSLACALIAEQLAETSVADKGNAFTAGIVHEIGRFALAVLRPKEYAALLDSHSGSPASLNERERELYGFDHRDAGLRLIADWGLPADFASILQPYDRLSPINGHWNINQHIHTSCHLANTAGFPAFRGCEALPYADLLETIPVRKRSLFHADSDRLTADLSSRINAIESVESWPKVNR